MKKDSKFETRLGQNIFYFPQRLDLSNGVQEAIAGSKAIGL
jgi:hypothetical protein